MRKSSKSAFTLIELMLVIAILLDLAVIALPAFIRSRNMAQNTKFISDLRTASGAFEMYAAENNKYPAASAASVSPTGMAQYLAGFPWTSTNSIGGQWVWRPDYSAQGISTPAAAIGTKLMNPLDDLRMTDVDSKIDNGVLSTGQFRKVDSNNFYFIIEN